MNNEFIIKIKTGYEENYFFKEGEKLDIISNKEKLSYNPVEIEIKKSINKEESELAATINGNYFDLDYMLDEGIDMISIFDSIDQPSHDLYNILFKENYYKEQYDVLNPNLFNLTAIKLEKNYNNIEHLKMIINSLGDILRYVAKLNVGVISTNINYYDKKEEKEIKNIFTNNDYISAKEDKTYLIKIFY